MDKVRSEMKLIERVTPRFGSSALAWEWYRSQPLPGFGDRTAKQLVDEGRVKDVHDYIDAVDAGIYA